MTAQHTQGYVLNTHQELCLLRALYYILDAEPDFADPDIADTLASMRDDFREREEQRKTK